MIANPAPDDIVSRQVLKVSSENRLQTLRVSGGDARWRQSQTGQKQMCRQWASALLMAAVVHVASVDGLRAQTSSSDGELQFDIPSQPLAAALRAYGKVSGLEVFYDGSLSIGRYSTAIKGSFKPMFGLKALLRGTGYVARTTEIVNTVTIVSAPPIAPLHATFDRYQPYFAVLQARLSETLCNNDESSPNGEEVTLRFWLDPSGVIANAELLDSDESEAQRRAITSKIQGLQIGKAPPAGLPQPLTMVIYPPSAGEATGCPPTNSRPAGN
jgi:hypothetical protein